MSDNERPIDWRKTTFDGSRREQLRQTNAMSVRQRLEALDQLTELSERIQAMPREQGLRVNEPIPSDVYESPAGNFMKEKCFPLQFEQLTGFSPMPWQVHLFEDYLAKGHVPAVVDIPTGLGKTSVIAVWLLALIKNPDKMPRRLVYVVNRRTVVDQTTAEVQRLRENLPKLGQEGFDSLAISTLRGQFVDNQEWREDPSRPAAICGTVDMIGSRLLFEGYRIGFKSRPLHAGFLGQDVLLVHDEAHLEPAFQSLIETIRDEQARERDRSGGLPWPGMRVMALSATARNSKEKSQAEERPPFGLTEEEKQPPEVLPEPPTKPIHHVWRRLKAKKSLQLHLCEDEKKLPLQVARLAAKHEGDEVAVLIFVRKVDDVASVVKELSGKHNDIASDRIETLTGTMRGYERDELVKSNPVFARFLSAGDRFEGATPAEGTVYLVCTSAGEVGVNLSADHMVCDLSTFDSMVQRLGRVNRFGDRIDTCVDVVHPVEFGKEDKKAEFDERREKTLALLQQLSGDASPKTLGELPAEQRVAAFAPDPTILPATDILFDAWALTTIRGKMPGRPPVAPYLHGVAEWEPPRTSVAWREEVEVITDELITREGSDFPQQLLADYPLKQHELLSDRTDRVYESLQALVAKPKQDVKGEKSQAELKRIQTTRRASIWLVDDNGSITVIRFDQLMDDDKKALRDRIANVTILLPPSVGGLSDQGTLDGTKARNPNHRHGYDIADRWLDENDQPRRQRVFSDESRPTNSLPGMALIRTLDTDPWNEEPALPEQADEDATAELNAENDESPTCRRYWHWYARPRDAEEATRASIRPIALDQHSRDVRDRAREIVAKLNLPDDLKHAIVLAAEWHDLGKRRETWQRSIGNPNPTDWYAKSGKPKKGPRWRPRYLSGYRHELGSVLDLLHANEDLTRQFEELGQDMRDVVLHLIATHHGYARPHFPPEAYDHERYNTRQNEEAALEATRRYARLQRRYGRWGLAYLESLVRAADWAASAHPSEAGDDS